MFEGSSGCFVVDRDRAEGGGRGRREGESSSSGRRPVVLAAPFPYLKDPRLGLRTVTFADPERIEGSGGRFVILLLDTPYWRRLERTLKEGLPDPRPTPPHHADVERARKLAAELRTAWGEPHLVSPGVLVWDLAQVGTR